MYSRKSSYCHYCLPCAVQWNEWMSTPIVCTVRGHWLLVWPSTKRLKSILHFVPYNHAFLTLLTPQFELSPKVPMTTNLTDWNATGLPRKPIRQSWKKQNQLKLLLVPLAANCDPLDRIVTCIQMKLKCVIYMYIKMGIYCFRVQFAIFVFGKCRMGLLVQSFFRKVSSKSSVVWMILSEAGMVSKRLTI